MSNPLLLVRIPTTLYADMDAILELQYVVDIIYSVTHKRQTKICRKMCCLYIRKWGHLLDRTAANRLLYGLHSLINEKEKQ